ncbi:MAG: plastocyanin/azurin family copper-binding protein, partial [Chloroflexota bacterium]
MHRLAARLVPLTALLLILAACSTGTQPSASPSMPIASDGDAGTFAWGEPAEAGKADRVIEITMSDQLRFEPASVEVRVGETVTFRVTNAGAIPHDFTLGDAETQDEHEAEMVAGGMAGMGHGEPNTASLDPGEDADLTWRFTRAGSIRYGCHLTGHYAAGMVGTITIV